MDNQKVKIIFYLRGMDRIKTKVDLEDFCSKDEQGNYVYTMADPTPEDPNNTTTYVFKSIDSLIKVIYAGIIDSIDKYHEAKLNNGDISDETVETSFAFGDIIVPIEYVTGVKVKLVKSTTYNDEDVVTVEMEDQ